MAPAIIEDGSSRREAILSALRHPALKLVEPGIMSGLNGRALVDNIIGVIERARDYAGRSDPVLRAGYDALRLEYPLHFPGDDSNQGRSREAKPDAYKALNGF